MRRLLILVMALAISPLASAIVFHTEGSDDQGNSTTDIVTSGQSSSDFGQEVSKADANAKKVFKDVDCKHIGCKDVQQDFFDDTGDDDDIQKTFKIKPDDNEWPEPDGAHNHPEWFYP